MINITKDNYDYYKKIFEIIWLFSAKLVRMDPYVDFSPVSVLANMEKKSKSLARKGLRIGLADQLGDLKDFGSKELEELNARLREHNLPTTNQLIALIAQVPSKVLKRGKIKNIDEYYIIKEVICDLAYNISQEDRLQLENILGEYEISAGKKQ